LTSKTFKWTLFTAADNDIVSELEQIRYFVYLILCFLEKALILFIFLLTQESKLNQGGITCLHYSPDSYTNRTIVLIRDYFNTCSGTLIIDHLFLLGLFPVLELWWYRSKEKVQVKRNISPYFIRYDQVESI